MKEIPQPLTQNGLQGIKWTVTGFGQVAAPLLRATAFRLRGKEYCCGALDGFRKLYNFVGNSLGGIT